MGFMDVALVCMGPRFPLWTLLFEPTAEERAEVERLFCEPYNVVGTAQIQIQRGHECDPGGYRVRVVSWDLCGPVWFATLAEVAKDFRIDKESRQ